MGNRSKRRAIRIIRPGLLIVVGVLIAAALVALAWAGQRYTNRVIRELIAEKSSAFVERVENVGSLTWRAEERIEDEIADRLLAAGRTVVFLEERGPVTAADLAKIADAHGVRTMHLLSSDGRIEVSSHVLHEKRQRPRQDYREACRPLFDGTENEQILGVHTPPGLGEPRFSVAVRRPAGGIVVASIDASSLAELRRDIGFGRLVQDLGKRADVFRVVVQDRDGIVAATSNVREVDALDEDPFLAAAWESGDAASREIRVDEGPAVEVVKRIALGDGVPFLVRIAVDSGEAVALARQTRNHFVVLVAGVLVFLVLAVYALVLYRDYRIASRAREQAETFSAEILQGMADAVWVVDDEERVVLSNDQARLLSGAGSSGFPEPLRGVLTRVREADSPIREDVRAPREGGPPADLAVAASTVRVEGDEPFTVLLARDETEVRRLEREVQRNEKEVAMGRLAGSVAHEVRNPLNAIGMTAQRLAGEFAPADGAEEYGRLLAIVDQEVVRLDGIITQFLQFARSPVVDTVPGDLRGLVESVAVELTGVANARGVALRLEAGGPVAAAFDARQMRQVVLNLLTNAIEASGEGDAVDLSVRAAGSTVAIVVADHGAGMAADERERVFDLYYSTKQQGTGLGMPIAARIVEAHGGSIEIESESGRGTRVIVRLPSGE